jgi:hypothetical protein
LGHGITADGDVKVARPWGLPRSANPAGGIVSTAVDQLKYARFHLGDGRAADGTRLLKAATVRKMQRPLAPAGSISDSVGVTWLLDKRDGTAIVKHGGSVNGHMSEFLLVPSRGFAVTVLTNGWRGHEVGTAILNWALEELLGLRAPVRSFRKLSTRAAGDYAGRYDTPNGEYVVTPDNGGLLLVFEPKKELLEADPDIAALFPPPLPVGMTSTRGVGFVQGDRNAGAKVEFLRDPAGTVEWLRFGGRINRRIAD